MVVYRPIFERWGAEVFIDMTLMVAGLVADTDESEVAPSLRRSAGGTDASVLSVTLWVPLFYLTGNMGWGFCWCC